MKKNYSKPAMEMVSVQGVSHFMLTTSLPKTDNQVNNPQVKENSWDVFGGDEE